MNKKNTVLAVNSSSRYQNSATRAVTRLIANRLLNNDSDLSLVDRDLVKGIDFIDEPWIAANFTAPDERSVQQRETLAVSDSLVQEVLDAQAIIIAAPLYNFSIPAMLKAWIDQIARANLTFKYTEDGPVGLIEGKKAYVVIASGGVPVGSDMDFSSQYLEHVLGFIGISDVTIIDASDVDLTAEDGVISYQLAQALAT